MLAIKMTDFRQHLPAYLDRVRQGESFTITVRGQVVARLIPDQDQVEAAYARLLALRATSWVGDVITPLDVSWSGDDDHL